MLLRQEGKKISDTARLTMSELFDQVGLTFAKAFSGGQLFSSYITQLRFHNALIVINCYGPEVHICTAPAEISVVLPDPDTYKNVRARLRSW